MSLLHLTDIFDTVQGEGSLVGQRMVFVRFSGCNLWNGREEGRDKGKGTCARWCDTDFLPRISLTEEELADRMDALWPRPQYGYRWACLTGGEPFLQVTRDLVERLIFDDGWKLTAETNGTVETDDPHPGGPLDHLFSHVCLSPKLGTTLKLGRADSLKVVLPGGEPGWTDDALDHLLATYPMAMPYVQPQAGDIGGLDACLRVIRRDPRWRLSLQTHKLIGLP